MKAPLDNFNLNSAPKGIVTQFFGENPQLYARFGMLAHNGIDFAQPHGSPMYAIEDALVVNVKNDPAGFGKHVRIIGATLNDGEEQNEWTYGHCADIFVKVGDKVKAGDKIATMGNTGFVVSGQTPFWKVNPFAGTHLHLGLRKVIENKKGWAYDGSRFKLSVLNYQNGYKGAIDPRPILETLIEKTPTQDPRIPLMQRAITLLQQLLLLKKSL